MVKAKVDHKGTGQKPEVPKSKTFPLSLGKSAPPLWSLLDHGIYLSD